MSRMADASTMFLTCTQRRSLVRSSLQLFAHTAFSNARMPTVETRRMHKHVRAPVACGYVCCHLHMHGTLVRGICHLSADCACMPESQLCSLLSGVHVHKCVLFAEYSRRQKGH